MKAIRVGAWLFLLVAPARAAVAGDVYLFGTVSISNFRCAYYMWAVGMEGWECWGGTRTVDSYTTFSSNTSAIALVRKDDVRVVMRAQGNATVNQSSAAVDYTGLVTCDGAHFGEFSFDLSYSVPWGGNSLKLILDPGYMWLGSGPMSEARSSTAPAYCRWLGTSSGSVHVTGDMGNSTGVTFRLLVVTEPSSLVSTLTALGLLLSVAARRMQR